jgi:AraC-like DNA-binding protein
MNFNQLWERVNDLGVDRAELEQCYEGLPFISRELVQSAANLAEIITSCIWLKDIARVRENTRLREITDYIENYFTERLSVSRLCERFSISKNTLYREFNDTLQYTVNEHVLRVRMAESQRLLRETDLPVSEVSEQAGFSSNGHFCKVFRQRTGMTPTQYRNR